MYEVHNIEGKKYINTVLHRFCDPPEFEQHHYYKHVYYKRHDMVNA